ncbi:MAG TPA: TIGR03621 family F420-dependent LLM class oxidoreductase [Verrucomicrobiae bacterium]|nr:TIGR03621 family F420-dependent LLM class oxidoreductase [Verrucomicrobiae bacterium]
MARKIRFSTQSGSQPTGQDWLARAKRLEAIGYATLSMPDHMVGGAWSNMPALGAAAAVTTKLRLGNLVLDNDFRNPVVLAREFATLDVISNGRVEIGLGAGWFDRDYQSTGIAFDRGRVRVARLAEAVTLMKRLFTEDEVTFDGTYYRTAKSECRPKTVQQPRPPILIAAGGPEILKVAGREADIVAVIPPGAGVQRPAPDDVAATGVRRQIDVIRDAAGSRFEEIELSCFLDVTLTDDREKTIAELAEKAKVDPAVLGSSVYRGIGTLDEVREHIVRVRRETGITYFCLRGPHAEELAPVVKDLSGT